MEEAKPWSYVPQKAAAIMVIVDAVSVYINKDFQWPLFKAVLAAFLGFTILVGPWLLLNFRQRRPSGGTTVVFYLFASPLLAVLSSVAVTKHIALADSAFDPELSAGLAQRRSEHLHKHDHNDISLNADPEVGVGRNDRPDLHLVAPFVWKKEDDFPGRRAYIGRAYFRGRCYLSRAGRPLLDDLSLFVHTCSAGWKGRS